MIGLSIKCAVHIAAIFAIIVQQQQQRQREKKETRQQETRRAEERWLNEWMLMQMQMENGINIFDIFFRVVFLSTEIVPPLVSLSPSGA